MHAATILAYPVAMDVTWRALTRDDVPAWNGLLAAVEAVDDTGEHFDEGDLYEELEDPATGPRDRIGAWYDGELVAFGAVRPRANPAAYLRLHAEGATHPQWRGHGLGSHTMSWIRTRAAEVQVEQRVDLDAHAEFLSFLDNTTQIDLLESSGLKPVNWSAVMRIALEEDPLLPEPRWPTGLVRHTYDEGWSVAMREAHNDAFLDHWGFLPWSAQMWQQWVDGSRNFRPGLSWVVVDEADPTTVVGYVQTNEYQAYQAATGRREAYLAKLGVRRAYRGRGLATALLRHALRTYAEAGYEESSLDVDTDNPTGAFQLYERVGYRIEHRTAAYLMVVPAGRPQPGRPQPGPTT